MERRLGNPINQLTCCRPQRETIEFNVSVTVHTRKGLKGRLKLAKITQSSADTSLDKQVLLLAGENLWGVGIHTHIHMVKSHFVHYLVYLKYGHVLFMVIFMVMELWLWTNGYGYGFMEFLTLSRVK